MRRVTANFIPRVLTAEKKENHLFAAADLLQYAESDADFVGNIIAGQETWICGHDPETKAQSSFWKPLFPNGRRKLAKFEARQKCCPPFVLLR
ncbi:hypothetical protein Cfor_03063 [Coptotermes formosanus]|jgi:hypothetical protein|uniref:Uncharacterized protein n=1 Tax=Coptotermes formosanus TaxID=36987 RepID=A0A6L2PTW9_COPFO|nr:hypothetical protein Cfor_03063 [Coptotermes formosanus]